MEKINYKSVLLGILLSASIVFVLPALSLAKESEMGSGRYKVIMKVLNGDVNHTDARVLVKKVDLEQFREEAGEAFINIKLRYEESSYSAEEKKCAFDTGRACVNTSPETEESVTAADFIVPWAVVAESTAILVTISLLTPLIF